jgi:hypothetical protein
MNARRTYEVLILDRNKAFCAKLEKIFGRMIAHMVDARVRVNCAGDVASLRKLKKKDIYMACIDMDAAKKWGPELASFFSAKKDCVTALLFSRKDVLSFRKYSRNTEGRLPFDATVLKDDQSLELLLELARIFLQPILKKT